MPMATERPIFIVGCPRSGTTSLRLMLRAHPRIAIAPETRFTLSAYEHRAAYGDLRKLSNRQALAEWIVAGAGTRFGDLGLDPHAVASEIVAGPPTLGSAIGIVFRAYARRVGKPRWGDQRPGYVQHIDVLLRLFPDAQIVHLIRDGRDCVASLKRTPWWRMGTYHAIATWTQAIDAGRAAARRLPAGSYTDVRYEHLVADPESELRRLCDFLQEEYVAEMAGARGPTSAGWRERHAAAGDATVPTVTRHERREAAYGLRGAGHEPSELERWELELCEAVMAERLMSCGYAPYAVGRPAVHHLARYTAITTHRRLAARKRAVLDRGIRAGEPQPVAARLGATADGGYPESASR
jgi:hypothetical protein